MTVEDEILKLRFISRIGLALIDFIQSIQPIGNFQFESNSWVYRPNNFVAFDIHYQRANNITLSLRGQPNEFDHYTSLPIYAGRGNYSRCKIESSNQLDAAAYYIRRALELYNRGRTRAIRSEKRIEQ